MFREQDSSEAVVRCWCHSDFLGLQWNILLETVGVFTSMSSDEQYSSTADISYTHTHTLTYIRRYYTPRYLHEYKPHYFPDLCLCLLFDLLSVGFYFFFTPHQRRSCSLQIPLYIYDPIILPLLSTPPPSPQPPPDVINLVRGPGVMSWNEWEAAQWSVLYLHPGLHVWTLLCVWAVNEVVVLMDRRSVT